MGFGPRLVVFIPPQIREPSLDNINSHIDLVLEKIHNAKKTLFILGQGVRQGGAIDDFRRIVESLDIPFIITRIAIDVFKTSFRFYKIFSARSASRANN